jgi:hypothetical protein
MNKLPRQMKAARWSSSRKNLFSWMLRMWVSAFSERAMTLSRRQLRKRREEMVMRIKRKREKRIKRVEKRAQGE